MAVDTGDYRAMTIWAYLAGKAYSPDAIRAICYAIEKLEAKGELEIFVSEEIDASVSSAKPVAKSNPNTP